MSVGGIWDQLVGAVCRPPRDDAYDDADLPGGARATFALAGGAPGAPRVKFYRQDSELRSPRGLLLRTSHFRPCAPRSPDGRLPCVIYCHTNSGSRRDVEEILWHLLPRGVTVFALDFAGSGRSQGEWVSLGAHEVGDLAAAVAYLRAEGSVSTLALWGRSMGAVTALLYAATDPGIAGVVADSPFSRLTDLMLELACARDGMRLPRPLARVALAAMRRAVRRRAAFDLDAVAPLDAAPVAFAPALFGHAAGDAFIAPRHSELLRAAYAGETELVSFEGDHNSPRGEEWYDRGVAFLLRALRADLLIAPEVLAADFLGGAAQAVEGDGERRGAARAVFSAAPSSALGDEDGDAAAGAGGEEDAALQRALELSLADAAAAAKRPADRGAGDSAATAAGAPAAGAEADADLAAAIAASLRLQGELCAAPPCTREGEGDGGSAPPSPRRAQASASAHAGQEAAAALGAAPAPPAEPS